MYTTLAVNRLLRYRLGLGLGLFAQAGGIQDGKFEDLLFADVQAAAAAQAVGLADDDVVAADAAQRWANDMWFGAYGETVTAVVAILAPRGSDVDDALAAHLAVKGAHGANMPAPAVGQEQKVE